MNLSGLFRVPTYNVSRYQQMLQEHLGRALADAAGEWLGATTALIPVWSGASQGTFLPLASRLGLQLTIAPRAFNTRVSFGESNATGDLHIDASAGLFTFSYSTTLAHLIYNEFSNANITPDPTLFARLLQPGPYRFQDAGEKAFREFAKGVRLPDPSTTITIRTIRA
jgi:hypothetical protein